MINKMQIDYLGHACFRLKFKNLALVMDPYFSEVGFKLSKQSADIVTVSHNHFDHNNLAAVVGKPFVISGPGEYETKEVSIYGLGTYHDAKRGEERGKNVIFVVNAEDISICHLGDLGHGLSSKQIECLGEINILMVPVGGVNSITVKQAAEVVREIEPNIVIPMHYKTPSHSEKFANRLPVENFLKEMGVERKEEERLTVTKQSLSEEMEVVVPKIKFN